MFKRLIFISLISFISLSPFSFARADSSTPPIQRLGTGIPTSIAASPDGKTLAVGSSIGVWLLDAVTLQPFGFWDTGFWVESMTYSLDGHYVKANDIVLDASNGHRTGDDPTQVIWANHNCTLDGKYCVEYSYVPYDGSDILVSAQVVNEDTLVHLKILENPVSDAAWSSDGTKLYYISGEEVRSLQTKTLWAGISLKGFFTDDLDLLAWSPDGTQIASGLAIWDANSGQIVGSRNCSWSRSEHSFPCEQSRIEWASYFVYLYGSSNNNPRYYAPHEILLTFADLSDDQQLIATSGGDVLSCHIKDQYGYDSCGVTQSSVRIWDAQTLKLRAQLPGLFYNLRLSPDDKIVVGHTQTTLEAWDWQSGQRLWSLAEDIGPQCNLNYYAGYYYCWNRAGEIAISPNGNYVATSTYSTGNTVHLYRLSTGEQVATFIGHTARITEMAFSPDGIKLAASSLDGTILIWPVP